VGDGSRVPRALIGILLGAATSACIDFVEPDLPFRGQPPFFQGVLRVWADGRAGADGVLSPGYDDDAVLRDVLRETVRAMNRAVHPMTVGDEGTRTYNERWGTTRDSVAGTLVFEAPLLAGELTPPRFRWEGITTPQDDTLEVGVGADLLLVVDAGTAEDPAPDTRQWLLTLSGATGALRIGADGVPPDTLLVPARFLPAPRDGIVDATLSYTRSLAVPQPAAYTGILALDARVEWAVRVVEPTSMPGATR
jgi:hypothetical protein